MIVGLPGGGHGACQLNWDSQDFRKIFSLPPSSAPTHPEKPTSETLTTSDAFTHSLTYAESLRRHLECQRAPSSTTSADYRY